MVPEQAAVPILEQTPGTPEPQVSDKDAYI